MRRADFLEEIETDLYGLWELSEFAYFYGKSDSEIAKEILKLMNDGQLVVVTAKSGSRRDIKKEPICSVAILLNNPTSWDVPNEDETSVFVVRNLRKDLLNET